jgi:hypothetical protein
LVSEILPASEVDSLASSDKFSALTQEHLRDTGISNYRDAETLVFLDDNSNASTVIVDSHDFVSTRVQRSCEDGESSDSPQLLHVEMKMKIWNVTVQNCKVEILDVRGLFKKYLTFGGEKYIYMPGGLKP